MLIASTLCRQEISKHAALCHQRLALGSDTGHHMLPDLAKCNVPATGASTAVFLLDFTMVFSYYGCRSALVERMNSSTLHAARCSAAFCCSVRVDRSSSLSSI